MTSDEAHDARADSLRRLMVLAPDPDRAERVRLRCRTQLARSRRRAARTAAITGFTVRAFGPVVVGTFCVFYAVVLAATTLALEGIFP